MQFTHSVLVEGWRGRVWKGRQGKESRAVSAFRASAPGGVAHEAPRPTHEAPRPARMTRPSC